VLSSAGLNVDNSVSWTESTYGLVIIYNCAAASSFGGRGPVSHGREASVTATFPQAGIAE
jgi:hypothetical protein